jgi:hypothetical protein
MMPVRPFDHVILMVPDLDAAAEDWTRQGFVVTPRFRHPFGTANRLVMFGDHFVELLTVEDAERAEGQGAGRFVRAAGAGGLAYALAFRSEDIEADHAALRETGLSPGPIRGFRRPVTLPDGRAMAAVVETTWLADLASESFALFLSRQHVAEAIWVPEWMRHPNGAVGIDRITLASGQPERLRATLDRVLDAGSPRPPAFEIVPEGEPGPAARDRITGLSIVDAAGSERHVLP